MNRNRRDLWLSSFFPHATRLTQDKQLPYGALNRRGYVETRRARWLSLVNPMAGSWSLAAYPRSNRPVSTRGHQHFRRIPSAGTYAQIAASVIVCA
jgi:hypothetical protein